MAETETTGGPSPEEFSRMQAALDAANRRADSAEGQLATAGARVLQSEGGRLSAEEMAADSTIAGLRQSIDRMEAEEAELQAEGKFREAGAVRTKISMAASQIVASEGAKAQISSQRQNVQRTAEQVSSDPVEAFFGTRTFSDDEKRWIRQNRRYATDPAFRERVNLAHSEAVGKMGHQPGSPEYYRHLEDTGYERQQAATRTEAAATGGGRQAPVRTEAEEIDNGEGSPFSDTGGEPVGTVVNGNEIIIGEEPAMERQAPAVQARSDEGRPEQPQPRAAGTAASTSIAAAPTRRSLSGSRAAAQQTKRYISPEEAQFAFSMAQTIAPDIAAKGIHETAAWWDEWKRSKRATELREKWATGG
jgi:hypothetical protein